MNKTLAQLSESFTIALADRVRQMKREGVPVIGLQTGDPDFNTPREIMDAAYEAMADGFTHYSNSRGLPHLRDAISDRVLRQTKTLYEQSEILVTHGAIHAYYVALQSILNAGDAVLVPDPTWQTHANTVKLLNGQAIRVEGLPENGFFPTLEAWQQALTPNTKALIINSPSNPTGFVAKRDYLEKLLAFAQANNLYIISDEVYDNLLYGVEFTSMASLAGAKERLLLINSLSKTYAMTGWRVGYLCAPEAIINSALKASQYTITNVAEFVQRAAVVALTHEGVDAQAKAFRDAYARRREQVLAIYDSCERSPIEVTAPEGAFYFFLDARKLGIPSEEMSERLLTEMHVAVVPGSAYGKAAEGFLRMTIAASDEDVTEGFRRILDWAEKAKD
jgi:aspartate/methionine/tyrosine aminotransferase